ncbi:MAG: von Willebrand factor type A domain-containing protein [Ferruginibacter sp.]
MKTKLIFLIPFLVLVLAFIAKNSFTVTGTISDLTGKPVAFASVAFKGSSNRVTSDAAGKYSIKVNDENGKLVFNCVGYDTKEVLINRQSVINVVMVQNTNELTEVVVTSLGSTSRDYANLSFGLQGKVSGLSIMSTASTFTNQSTSEPYHVAGNQLSDTTANTEGYAHIIENSFQKVTDNPLSTFSIDVDAASYSNVRRFINDGQLPPAGAVRIEEMINYFKYNYPEPEAGKPFSITTELGDCPWNHENKLLMIGLHGKEISADNLPASNLVFLIDVSGSMMDENKLPLVKASLKLLTDQLRQQDKISIVVYAGNAGLVLPATDGSQKEKIKSAIDALEAGGSTAGGAGIKLAYKIAKGNFLSNGNNRVILCTDGDFNVGASSDDDMVRLIEKERESGVFLTVLGYGMGNYQDSKMQQLADKGNGNHAYIDGLSEAKRVLVNEFGGTLFTIAKDVKLQLEFNPARIAGYRLIGYENRMLNKEDFKDDKKDAGELGSGHTVTALYEIIPAGVKSTWLDDNKVDKLKYQQKDVPALAPFSSNELLTVKFRYKDPKDSTSKLLEHPFSADAVAFTKTSDNFYLATAVAGFGMLLRNSKFKGTGNYKTLIQLCNSFSVTDKEGYRKEFVSLVKKANELTMKNSELANVREGEE